MHHDRLKAALTRKMDQPVPAPVTVTNLFLVADASREIEPLDWWKRHETDLPKWSGAARKIVLVQPSSAAAERVFSILHCSFGDRQQHALEDYIEASVQLQYNNR